MDVFFVFVFGAIFGSFLNVIVYRLPQLSHKTSSYKKFLYLCFPRSYCTSCKKTISIFDLFPIINFFYLRGKCRYCNTKISLRYPVVEVITAFLFVVAYLQYGLTIKSLVLCIIIFLLLSLAIIDWETFTLPDELNYLLLICSTINLYINNNINVIISGLLSGLFAFSLLYIIHKYYMIVKEKDALGFGDVKLILSIGILVPIPKLFQVLIISSLLGIILLVIKKRYFNKELTEPVQFGTLLILTTFFYIF